MILYTEKERTAAFTGHRRITPPVQGMLFAGDDAPQEYIRAVARKLDDAIEALAADGYGTFLCGMAAGFDLMAGLAVCRAIEQGAPLDLVALVPHPGQAARFPPQDRRDYQKVLSMATEVHTVCPEYRTDCFHRRNDLLVAHSSALVCYYDGRPGGTHYTAKKALKEGHRIINTF